MKKSKVKGSSKQPCNLICLLMIVSTMSAIFAVSVLIAGHKTSFLVFSSACLREQFSIINNTSKPPSYQNYKNASSWEGLLPPPDISLHKLFSSLTPTARPSHFAHVGNPANFSSHFLQHRVVQHRQFALRNACMEPGGRLLLVNASREDVDLKTSHAPGGIPGLPYLWAMKYHNCGNTTTDECVGLRYVAEAPTYARYVPGNTMHFIAYFKDNTMHNFAERVWPRLPLAVAPFNETSEGLPVHHFIFHRLDQILEAASQLNDKDQVLWQFRMLMELWPGSDLLRVKEGDEEATFCFDTLLLQMHDDYRMDKIQLPLEIIRPAVRKYRDATFRFLNLTLPEIPLPPRPIRLVFYGRTDLSRRRVTNHDEILDFLLHNISRPNLEIRSLDLLFHTSQMDTSFTRVVSLFSQTDILVISHGAITWASLFLPIGAGLIEVFGSCDWWKPKERYADPMNMKTWVGALTHAIDVKHDLSNPFRESVANPKRGNTTLCIHPATGVPHFTIDPLKMVKVLDSFAYPQMPGDRLTLHWLYDWKRGKML